MLTVPNDPSIHFSKAIAARTQRAAAAKLCNPREKYGGRRLQFSQFGHNCRAARTAKQPGKRSCMECRAPRAPGILCFRKDNDAHTRAHQRCEIAQFPACR